MPSPAVPNTDLPGPDLPGPDLPETDLRETEAGSGPDDGTPGPSATLLRCGGCGTSAVIDQDEHRYGGLVHSFLGQHSGCGNAVQITRTHGTACRTSAPALSSGGTASAWPVQAPGSAA